MGTPDARLERRIEEFAHAVREALGDRLLCCALVGSAAADDWVAGRSDVNTAIVVRVVDAAVLDALGPVVRTFGPHGFAVPLVVEPEFLARAVDVFPMELADLRRQHRVLWGRDVLAAIGVEPAALRRQCEHEARSRLLRLRALCLAAPTAPDALDGPLLECAKSVLVLLRHLGELRGDDAGGRYADALAAGERLVGPLPVLARLLRHRDGEARLAPKALAAELPGFLAEVERVVRALDTLDA